MSSAHNVYQYGSTGIPVPSTITGLNINESYNQWKNFPPIQLTNTSATVLPNCPCGYVQLHNPLGNDIIYIGGSGTSDLPQLLQNNPGMGIGTPLHPGTSRIFRVANMNLLAAIAVRNGDFLDPQASLSQTDFTTPATPVAPNPNTFPPLTVTSTTPNNGATNVLNNQIIQIVFNRPINTSTINSTNVVLSPALNPINISRDDQNTSTQTNLTNQIDIDPLGANLMVGTTYTVTIGTGIQDNIGLMLLTPYVFSFTVGSVPTVVSVNPGNSATNVPVNSAVKVVMNEAVKNTTVNTSSCQIVQISNSSAVTSSVSLGGDGITITITPSANLAFNTAYKVVISGVTNPSGTLQQPNPWDGATQQNKGKFTTGSAVTVSSSTPGNNSTNIAVNTTVVVVMSAQVKSSTVNSTNVQLQKVSDNSVVTQAGGSPSLAGDGVTITITPSANLANGVEYKTVLSGVQDLNGVTQSPSPWDGDAQSQAGDFTTVPPTPNVVSVSPGGGSTGVAVNSAITITMNTAVQASNCTTSNVQLINTGTSQAVACGLSLGTGNTVITLTPSANLLNLTTYKVVVQNQTNTAGTTQSPNPWDGHTQGPNSGQFTTKDFTSRYNVSQTSSPCSNSAQGWGPVKSGNICGGNATLGLGTCSDDYALGFGEKATVANGLTAAPITKVTIVALSSDANDYSSQQQNAGTGTFSIKIISGTTVKYTFSQTWPSSSSGYNSICNVNCGGGGGTISGWTSVTLIDTGNTYTMAVGDAIAVMWSGTCQNTALVSDNIGGSPNNGCAITSGNTINSLSNQDFAAQMWSSL